MGVFAYSGRDQSGAAVKGQLEANNREAVATQLLGQGVTPVSIEPHQPKESVSEKLERWWPLGKIPIEEYIMFCRQMYSLNKAGIPIIRGLNALSQTITCRPLKLSLTQLIKDLEGGNPLSTAMANQPEHYTPIFISMMRVGENTGNLDEAFKKVAEHFELERETKKRIKQATRYPILVVSAITVAIGVINFFVIPAFSSVFKKVDMELPLPTKILLGTSNFMVNYWWLLLAVLVGGFFAFIQYIKTEEGRLAWDRLKLRFPLIGTVFKRIIFGRFSRVFAMLMRSGVPVTNALNVVAGALGNEFVSNKVRAMQGQIERGENLTRAAAASEMFTPLVLQMIAVGEETGAIEEMLDNVADFYEEEVDYQLKRLSDAIEPILLVVMGIMVLILALGVFLPMWNLSSLAAQ